MSERENWFLIRGLTRESGHWGTFAQQLASARSQADIFALDLPGTGKYWREKSPLSLAANVKSLERDLRAITDTQAPSPARKNYLLSISLGSMVALQWMKQTPDHFAGAVLINPSFARLSPIHKRLRWQNWPHLAWAAFHRSGVEREKLILRMTSHRTEVHEETAQHYADLQRRHPVSLKNFARQLAAAATFRLPPVAPATPMLLLNSREDRFVDRSCSEAIEHLWHLPMRQHPSAGHDLPLDAPDWICEQISVWLSSSV